MKELIVKVCELQKFIICGDGTCSSHPQSQSLHGRDLFPVAGVQGMREGMLGKSGKTYSCMKCWCCV